MRLYIWLGKQDVSDCVPLMVHTKSRKLSLKQEKKKEVGIILGQSTQLPRRVGMGMQ